MTLIRGDGSFTSTGQLCAEDIGVDDNRPGPADLTLSDCAEEGLLLFVRQALDDHLLVGRQRPSARENLLTCRKVTLLGFVCSLR